MLEAAPATGVWVEATPLAVFGKTPGAGACTDRVTVQLAGEAGMVSPEKLSTPVCAALKALPLAPAQLPPANPVALTCIPESVSEKEAPVSGTALGLLRVKLSRLVPPAAIGLVPKLLVMVAAEATTREAELEGAPWFASLLDTPPAALG